jgi:hypothetical protein
MAYKIEGPKGTLVYCANYRTGSKSTGKTILEMGGTLVGSHHSPLASDGLVVETVRHHCDVIVSWWYKIGRRKTIEAFIEEILDGTNPFLDSHSFYNKFPSNYVIRYPALEVEFQCAMNLVGLEPPKIHRTKPRPDSKWQRVIPGTLQTKVLDRYEHEIERLGLWQ